MASALVIIGLALVILAGLLHVVIFLLESVLWRSRATWRRFGVESAEDAKVARPWALNQGFYNLFLAIGAILGGLGGIVATTRPPAWGAYVPLSDTAFAPPILLDGWGLVAAFCALCMVGAAIVLIVSSRGRLLRGALVQGAAPLVGLVLLGIGLLA